MLSGACLLEKKAWYQLKCYISARIVMNLNNMMTYSTSELSVLMLYAKKS